MLKLVFSLSSLSLIGYFIGFLNQIVIANKFGTSSELDMYLLALSIVNFGWFFVGALNETAIPPFFNRYKDSFLGGSVFFSQILNLLLLLSLLSMSIIYFGLDFIYMHFVDNGEMGDYGEFSQYVNLLLPVILLTVMTQFLQAVLNSLHKFIAQSIGKIVTASFTLFFMLFFIDILEIKAILFGLEIGLVALMLLQFALIHREDVHYRMFNGFLRDKKFYLDSVMLIFTFSVSAFQIFFERFVFVSFGDGALSSFNYASALIQVPQYIVISGIVAISWTKFMTYYNANENEKGLVNLGFIAFMSFFSSALLAAFINVYSKEIIYILFFRGEFSYESLEKASFIVKYLALSLPFIVVGNLLGRAFSTMRMIKIMAKINLFSALMSAVILAFAYSHQIMLVAALTPFLVHLVIVGYKIYLYEKMFSCKYIFWTWMKTMLAGCVLFFIYWFTLDVFHDDFADNIAKLAILFSLSWPLLLMATATFLTYKISNSLVFPKLYRLSMGIK